MFGLIAQVAERRIFGLEPQAAVLIAAAVVLVLVVVLLGIIVCRGRRAEGEGKDDRGNWDDGGGRW